MLKRSNPITYTAFGFNILSEFLLPELIQMQIKESQIDLIIKKEDLSSIWSKHVKTDTYYYFDDNFCMIRVPNVGIYKIENGNTISVSPFLQVEDDHVRLYILGTCMGIILMQRKILPLHGSCIAIDGKAYAFVGDSGVGKSTLASVFIKRGFKLLTDDVIAVNLSAEHIPVVTPSYPHQKLWQESLDKVGMNSNQFNPIYGRETKFTVPVTTSFHNKILPLAGIFTLSIGEQEEINISSVRNLERLPILFYNTYRQFIIPRLNLTNWHFNFSTKIVNKLSFYHISRPSTRFTSEELADDILSLLKNFDTKNIKREKIV